MSNDLTSYLEAKSTTIHIDIRFKKDDQYFHLVNFQIVPESLADDDSDYYDVGVGFLSFRIDRTLNTNDEIVAAVVDYLDNLKLYLHSYRIIGNRTFVSYRRRDPAYGKNLIYSPSRQDLNFYVAAETQLEDDIDYVDELKVKFFRYISGITQRELDGLGLRVGEAGINAMAILHENDMPERLRT